MKIGELQEHCGNCGIIDFCTEAYKTPQLCVYEELADVEEAEYRGLLKTLQKKKLRIS